jgi:hypothetical protein
MDCYTSQEANTDENHGGRTNNCFFSSINCTTKTNTWTKEQLPLRHRICYITLCDDCAAKSSTCWFLVSFGRHDDDDDDDNGRNNNNNNNNHDDENNDDHFYDGLRGPAILDFCADLIQTPHDDPTWCWTFEVVMTSSGVKAIVGASDILVTLEYLLTWCGGKRIGRHNTMRPLYQKWQELALSEFEVRDDDDDSCSIMIHDDDDDDDSSRCDTMMSESDDAFSLEGVLLLGTVDHQGQQTLGGSSIISNSGEEETSLSDVLSFDENGSLQCSLDRVPVVVMKMAFPAVISIRGMAAQTTRAPCTTPPIGMTTIYKVMIQLLPLEYGRYVGG